MIRNHGQLLREEIAKGDLLPFMGVYDVFSASLSARHFNGLFLSGFSFAASFYGLPDIGFICWSDLVNCARRIRTILPNHHLLVDIDDGFGDSEIACHVVSLLEAAGVSGVIMEDQKRPRRCGHFPGKQLLELDEFLIKLNRVLDARKDLFIIARTDATDSEDRMERAQAFSHCGADAILVEALPTLETAEKIKELVECPLMVNQIAGGISPTWSFTELKKRGISLVNFSTPCLFGAQTGIEKTLLSLKVHDGKIQEKENTEILNPIEHCTKILYDNLNQDNHTQ